MEPFAYVSDVEAIWGDGADLTDWQRSMIASRIDQASADIRECSALVGGLTIDQRVAVSPNFGVVVRGIVVDMIRRLLTNPDGHLEVGVDDARVRWNAVMAQGELMLTAHERDKLAGGALNATAGAFSIRPGRAFEDTGRVYAAHRDASWLYTNLPTC